MHPDLTPVRTVAQLLWTAGIEVALGGSGLLYALGLGESVRDWDLTTDAPLELVRTALGALPWQPAPCGDGPFASHFRLTVGPGDPDVDLMGHFSIRSAAGTCHLPTMPGAAWQGVPVGSPAVWAVAYRLMGRHPKADRLSAYLRAHGAPADHLGHLQAQPLPPAVQAEIAAWPCIGR